MDLDDVVPSEKLVRMSIPPGDTNSETSFGKLRGWLQTCVSSHPLCASKDSSRLPTRVLEINPKGEDLRVRLFVPQSIVHAPYVCLSHCWGHVRPTCLTTHATLERNMKAITPETMPKTFRDSISVTHRLGFKYLWIDSMQVVPS
jgi:hypothetical protein